MNTAGLSEKVQSFLKPGIQRRRLLMAVLGVCICGIGVAFFKESAFGVDPFQCLCNGLDLVIPIDFGTLYVLINLVLLILVVVMNRHYIGVATLVNLFLLGYVIDFAQQGIHALMGTPDMALRIVYITIGIGILCVASSLYFTADLGVSTYDAIALHLSKTLPIPFKFIRIATDLICVLVGLALGYVPGVGTIITAFFMGPLISFFNRTVAEPLLHGKKSKAA